MQIEEIQNSILNFYSNPTASAPELSRENCLVLLQSHNELVAMFAACVACNRERTGTFFNTNEWNYLVNCIHHGKVKRKLIEGVVHLFHLKS